MAEEVRRSVRATKGQHTKNDTPEPPSKKVKVKSKRAPKEEVQDEVEEEEEEDAGEDDEAIIRCVCGYTVEDKRDKRAMVCCDSCEAWQHNVHMGLSEDDDELPEQYFCEQCRPEAHKELLEAIERGEKLWETREQEAKIAKSQRKRGKGGRKGATTDKDVSGGDSSKGDAAQQSKLESGQKRKNTASSAGTESANKLRKTSVAGNGKDRVGSRSEPVRRDSKQQGLPLQMELVEEIGDLRDANRQKAALALSKLFAVAGKAGADAGAFKVPVGTDLSSFSQKLALNVEYAMFLLLWGREETPKPEYGAQLRQILHNVKHNDELRNKLLNGETSPNELCNMSSTDMASKELLQKTAEMKKQVEQQSILIQDKGNLVRRNHKGEEIVDNSSMNLDGATTNTFRRPKRILTGDDSAIDHSPVNASPTGSDGVELPPDVHKIRSPNDISKLSLDTRRRSSAGLGSGRKSSATFDVDKVWSSVESPSTPARPTPAHRRTGSQAKADPEIDRLLKEEHEDDEEYSPADYGDPDTVWGGGITMATVTEFRATAKYAAGADLSGAYPWTQLMPELLSVEGRIDINDANSYLCNLQYSKTSDLTVVSVTPADHQEDKNAFNKLFDYLLQRQRYGVIRESPVTQVKDIYVIPLEIGSSQPVFLELLVDNALPAEQKSRLLLIAYVIKCTPKAEQNGHSATAANPAPSGGVSIASPKAGHASGVWHTPSGSTNQMSPIPPAVSAVKVESQGSQSSIPANPYANTPIQQPGSVTPSHHSPATIPQNPYATQHNAASFNVNRNSPGMQAQIPQNSGGGGLTGMAAAIHILGDLANCPAISQLLSKSPNVGVNELGHVKDVFLESPDTRSSLDLLLPQLQRKIAASPDHRA